MTKTAKYRHQPKNNNS